MILQYDAKQLFNNSRMTHNKKFYFPMALYFYFCHCLFVDKQDQLPPNLHHPMFVLFLLTKSDLKIQIRFLSLCFLSILDYVFPVFCEDAYSAPFSSTIILYRLTSFLREAVWITLLCKMGGLLIPSLWVTVHCCRNLLVWIHRV